jgi:hypothetical protein
MLDHGIRARKDQGDVLVIELHEVGRFPACSADFDDLTGPLWLTHNCAMYVDHIPDYCLHDACLLARFLFAAQRVRSPSAPRRTRARSTQAGRETSTRRQKVTAGC